MTNEVSSVRLGSWDKHIDNGGLSLRIVSDDGCVSINTEHDYCGLSHSSCLFCGSDVGPAELLEMSHMFKAASEKLAFLNQK